MAKFLEQVAGYYRQKYGSKLGRFTFLLPNQRSCLFFKLHLLAASDKPVEMPTITTLAYYMAKASGYREGSRNELLFTMYNAYVRALKESQPNAVPRDYDRFLFWGSMMVDDFDEIDYAQSDAKRIFSNINSIREISADYLSAEQKDAIREMWGESEFTREIENFWYHVTPCEGGEEKNHRNFVTMWDLMYRIYQYYKESLREQHIGSRGLQVCECLESFNADAIKDDCFAVIGFSNVSVAECKLFDKLRTHAKVDFFWDFHSPLFEADSPFVRSNRALQLIAKLQKTYAEPQDFEYEQPEFPSQINIVGLPSKIYQAKQSGSLIGQWLDEGIVDESDRMHSINTAVVLPDTSILQSFLLSLPTQLNTVNVTMGVPFNQSGFATFMRVAIRLQSKAIESKGRWTYSQDQVLAVLSNPHLNLFAQDEAEDIRLMIERKRLKRLDAEQLCEGHPKLAFIFRPMGNANNAHDAYAYVDGLLSGLRQQLVGVFGESAAASSMEINILDGFILKLGEIRELIEKYNIQINQSTYLQMFEHLLHAEPLPMTGTPLKGLQVMGVLETRCLDFDNIIFLSMNERTYPRRHYVRTMIPNVVRLGHGLPAIEQAESFYGYYFYRAISGARRVTVYYDARVGFSGSGEMSRYLNQLIYVDNDLTKINHTTCKGDFSMVEKRRLEVPKEGKVKEVLEQYITATERYLSASSLKMYLNCPLRFYFNYIARIKEIEDVKNYVDEAQMGTIYHNTMMHLFEDYKGQQITLSIYDAIINEKKVREIVEREVAREGFGVESIDKDHATCEYIILVSNITNHVLWSLQVEKREYAEGGKVFDYIDGELELKQRWQITQDLCINFKMIIDRLDQLAPDFMRFIDYKTGSDSSAAGDYITNVFDDHNRHGIFQLMLYAEAYNALHPEVTKALPSLHVVRDIVRTGHIAPIKYKRKDITEWTIRDNDFRPELEKRITELFDWSVPFRQTEKLDNCRFCKFNQLCMREPQEYNK